MKVPSKRERRYWSKGRLLGDPWQEHSTGKAGSTTIYPAGTAARLIAIQRVRGRSRRRIETLRFELWWNGQDVERTPIRESLARDTARSSKRVAGLHRKHRGDPDGFADSVDRLLRKTYRRPRAAPWRLILARLDYNVEDLFSLAYLLALIAAGGEVIRDDHSLVPDDRSRADIFARLLGLHRTQSEIWAGGEPALHDSTDAIAIFEELQASGVLDPTEIPGLVMAAEDRDLDLARDRARTMIEQLGAAAAAAELLYGRDAFGVGYFATLFRERALRHVRGQAIVALLLVARALPEGLIDDLIRTVSDEACGPIALGEFVRRYPESKGAMRQLARGRPDALDEQERRRIQEEMAQFLADRPELAAKFELK